MFDWIDFDHGVRKAHISLGVMFAVLIGGTVLIGFDAPDPQHQAVTVVALIAGYTCLFLLFARERRQRAEQAERDGQSREGDSSAETPTRDHAVRRS